MSEPITVIRTAEALAVHSAKRQTLVATNVANADTPNYRASDLPDFAQTMASTSLTQRATRPGHMSGLGITSQGAVERPGEASPNGNNVSIEGEMVQAAGIKKSHDLALSIFTAAHGILSASIGRGR